MSPSRAHRLAAEALGTAFLLAAIIGSGIMGERLAGGNVAIALLANSVATGCVLAALIAAFAPISGAHFNPVVTIVAALARRISWRDAAAYVAAQGLGAFAGVAAAHFMFAVPLFSAATKVRTGPAQWSSEALATFGLVVVVESCVRHRLAGAPAAIAAYIVAAYWFTSSTSFANPAVTLARAASDTFAGVRPDDVTAFVLAQLAGALAAWALMCWLAPAGEVVSAPRSRR